tara:strand:+ start:1547 stop:1738 length:192 start_codon:yes stop_codon:yes gene_type:complete
VEEEEEMHLVLELEIMVVQVVVVLTQILVEQDQTILDQLNKVSLVAEVVEMNHLEVAAVAAVS